MNAASNRANRQKQVRLNRERMALQKQHTRLVAQSEKFQRKFQAVQQKRDKPVSLLKEQYAAGKMDEAKYHELLARDSEITIDLIVFGRNAGLKLSARYLSGQIDHEQFEKYKEEILGQPEVEKTAIINNINECIDRLKEFVALARTPKFQTGCNYCGKPKGFFSPLSQVEDMVLCGKCKGALAGYRSFKGYEGDYYRAEPCEIALDGKTNLTLNIKDSHILAYS